MPSTASRDLAYGATISRSTPRDTSDPRSSINRRPPCAASLSWGASAAPRVHLPFTATVDEWGALRRPPGRVDIMTSTLRWEPPSPGPWQQDSAHTPVAQSPLLQKAYP